VAAGRHVGECEAAFMVAVNVSEVLLRRAIDPEIDFSAGYWLIGRAEEHDTFNPALSIPFDRRSKTGGEKNELNQP